MRIELSKYLKNWSLLGTSIFWIAIMIYLIPRKNTFSSPGNYLFEGTANEANPFVYLFSSFNAYAACLFLPVACYLMYAIDNRLYKTRRLNFLHRTLPQITISKISVLTLISVMVYSLNLLIFGIVIFYRFGVVVTDAPYLMVFLTIKFVVNSFIFNSFLVLAMTLLKIKYQIVYFIGCAVFLFFAIVYSASNYTPFNWFVNSLGYLNRLRNSDFRPLTDLKPELLMVTALLLLVTVFLIQNEKKRILY